MLECNHLSFILTNKVQTKHRKTFFLRFSLCMRVSVCVYVISYVFITNICLGSAYIYRLKWIATAMWWKYMTLHTLKCYRKRRRKNHPKNNEWRKWIGMIRFMAISSYGRRPFISIRLRQNQLIFSKIFRLIN